MQAGKLRHRIRIQAKVQDQDEWGEPLELWEDRWTSVPADIRAVSGNEGWTAQQVQSNVNTEIEIRYRRGVTAAMRAIHETREQLAVSPQEMTIYDIEWIKPDRTGRRELVLMCVSRDNPGFRSGTR
jgi:SPP1 family predicted phage head-tail adaptor